MGKKAHHWGVVVAAYALFALLLTAGITSIGSHGTVASAAAAVVPSGAAHGGAILKLNQPGKTFPLFNRYFHLPAAVEVCWVTAKQLVTVRRLWPTTATRIQVGRGSFTLVTVKNAQLPLLRARVSPGPKLRCTMVHRRFAFFLPLDGNLS